MKETLEKIGVTFSKRFEHCPTWKWADMVEWCEETFNSRSGIYRLPLYDRTWLQYYPTFYFRDEQQYTMFLLRWV